MTRAGRREEGILLTHLPSRCGGESRRAGREARHSRNLQRVCALLGVAWATFEGAPLALAGSERWPVLLPLRPARDRFGAGVSWTGWATRRQSLGSLRALLEAAA